MVIRRIGVFSLGKVLGLVYLALGLLVGALFSMASLMTHVGTWGFGQDMAHTWLTVFFGLGAVLALPALYGFFGFLLGLLVAAVYNLIAGAVGGLEVEVE